MKNQYCSNKQEKNLIIKKNFVDDILIALEKIVLAVKSTMGPEGKNIIIEQQYDEPKVVRDGVTVAKSINLNCKKDQVIAKVFKQAITKTNELVGDGTSTTTVLTYSILKSANKMFMAGWNKYDIIKSITKVMGLVLLELDKLSKKLVEEQDIINVASISASSNILGNIIAKGFKHVGRNGAITVENSNSSKTELFFTPGITLNSGYSSRFFITNEKKSICELKNPYVVLISTSTENSIKDYFNLIKILVSKKRDFILLVENMRDEILQTFVNNKINMLGVFKNTRFAIVKLSGFGDSKQDELKDISVLTNSRIVGSAYGLLLNKITENNFGGADKIIIYKDKTIIIGGKGDKNKIKNHIDFLKHSLSKINKKFEKESVQTRLMKFGAGIAVIAIGASTEAEATDKKERVDDAINSTKSALRSGIVPGGAVIYLKLIHNIKKQYINDKTLKIGINIIEKAFEFPIKCIIENSDQNSEYIVTNLKNMVENNKDKLKTIGYDVISKKYVNMLEAGIIDSAEVVKCAIVNSLSTFKALFNSTGISILKISKENGTNKLY